MGKKIGVSLASRCLVALAFVVSSFASVTACRATEQAAQTYDTSDFERVKKLIKERHVENSADEKAMFYGSIKGMVEALNDPHSEFTDPEETKKFEQGMAGKFFGIGAELDEKDKMIIITAPMEGSPAAKAGLLPGDIILAVNGESVSEMKTIRNVIKHIRGPKGTKVKLMIMREGADKPWEVEIVRDEITSPSVKTKVVTSGKKRIMVVTLMQFNPLAAKLFRQAAVEALVRGLDGFVLDLRNDPGGYISIAGSVACSWIPRGQPFVTMVQRGEPPKTMDCGGPDLLSKMPTVVLVNGYSASASEITAGALQDYGKARVIGEKTYGKGCGQDLFKFPDGSELRLTTFYWNTPKNRSIHKKGIEPDEVLKADPADLAKKKDVQLDRAIQYLTEGR